MSIGGLSPRAQSLLVDLTTAAAVAVLALGVLPIHVAATAHGLAMAVALLWRRHQPVAVFAVIALLAGGQLLVPGRDYLLLSYDVAVLIGMYSVVRYAGRLVFGVLAGAVSLLGVLLLIVRLVEDASGAYVFGMLALGVVVVWLLGLSMRTRQFYVASLEERAATAERERDHLARIAVVEERARIARELHDVVAHSLSVMIVQADGATLALDRAPQRAREALRTVSATGRGALVEMGQLVAVLRSPDGSEEPRARESVHDAVERARLAGLRVRADVDGEPDALPAGVELAVYRVVQESITNALKHAGEGAVAELRLTYRPDRVDIDFRDDGAGRPARDTPPGPGGHGLVGMRERVAVYGGDLTVGPRPSGGWQVTASIPLGREIA